MKIEIIPWIIVGSIVLIIIIPLAVISAINSAREEGKKEGIKEGEQIDKCSTGTVLNKDNNKCEIVSCIDETKPVFNEITKQCEDCPPGTKFENGKCVVDTCSNSKVFNDTTKQCEDCPPGTKFENGKCVVDTCSNSQVFNDTTNTCEDCPLGTEYDNGKCVLKNCDETKVFNSSSGECEDCPVGTQIVNGVCEDIVCIQGKQLNGNVCEDIICGQGQELIVNSCLPICGVDEWRLGVDCVVSYIDETFPPIVAARAANPNGDLDLSMYKAIKIAPDFLSTVNGKYSNFSTIYLPTVIGEDTIFTGFLEGNSNLNFVTEQLSRDFFKPFAKVKGIANASFVTKDNWYMNAGFSILDLSPLENLEFFYVPNGWFVNTSTTKLKELIFPPNKIKTYLGNMFMNFISSGDAIQIIDFNTCTAEFDLDHYNLYNTNAATYGIASLFGVTGGSGNTTLREVRGSVGAFINSYIYSLRAAGLHTTQTPRLFDGRKGIEIISDFGFLQTCNLASTSFNGTRKLKSFDTNINVVDENGDTVPLTYPSNHIMSSGSLFSDSMIEMEVLNLSAFRNITYFGTNLINFFILPSAAPAGLVPFTQDVDLSKLKSLNQTIPVNLDIMNNLVSKFDLVVDTNGYPLYKIIIPNVDEVGTQGTHYPGAILANYFLNYYYSQPGNAPGDVCYYVCQENGQYVTKQTYQETV